MSGRPVSRRSVLLGLSVVPILAACAAATPTVAPPKPTEAPKPAAPAAPAPAAAPTNTPAAAAPAAPAAAPTKPAEAPKPAEPTKPAVPAAAPAIAKPVQSGVFNVWYSANWNVVTDKAIGDQFIEWGKTQSPEVKVEWQAPPGSPAFVAQISAAVAAGQPPELSNAERTFWYERGEMPATDDLVNKTKDKAGGMFELAVQSMKARDGKMTGVPYAIDAWPVHWREDRIKPALGGRYFNNWEEVVTEGPKIQQPPRDYMVIFPLGHEGDHMNSIVNVLWDYGGRLNNEEGIPDIANKDNIPGIELIQKLWKAKLIPPDTFAQTVTSWNNETYQKGRGLMTINPATIMGWLLVNDKELGEKTGLQPTPKGSKGAFSEGAGIGFNYFKKSKLVDKAPAALEYFSQPAVMEKVSKSVEGRFVPVYRDHAKGDFWEKSKFAEMKKIAENGRVRNWPAPIQGWISDVTEAKYTMSDMMNKILNENMKIEEAQAWAQKEMMDSYNKFK